MDPASIITVANLISQMIGTGIEMATAWEAGRNLIDKMVAEDRDPTEEELDTLRADIEARGARIQDA